MERGPESSPLPNLRYLNSQDTPRLAAAGFGGQPRGTALAGKTSE